MSNSHPPGKTKWGWLIAGNIAVCGLILLILEGGSSYLLILSDILKPPFR